jgi:hypothetical protein
MPNGLVARTGTPDVEAELDQILSRPDVIVIARELLAPSRERDEFLLSRLALPLRRSDRAPGYKQTEKGPQPNRYLYTRRPPPTTPGSSGVCFTPHSRANLP